MRRHFPEFDLQLILLNFSKKRTNKQSTMGRRNTSSTKSGKYMNPTDQVRSCLFKHREGYICLSSFQFPIHCILIIVLILGEERGTKEGAKKEQKAKVMCGKTNDVVLMSGMRANPIFPDTEFSCGLQPSRARIPTTLLPNWRRSTTWSSTS